MKLSSHLGALAVLLLTGCASQKFGVQTPPTITGLKLLSQSTIPSNILYHQTTVGGLSSIDYNAALNEYYLICDDRSAINPARFYTAKIDINNGRIDSIYFIATTFLQQANGALFPSFKTDPQHTPDPESMRWNNKTSQLVWSSEGERITTEGQPIYTDPFVHVISKDGVYVDSFQLPNLFRMQAEEKGPRQNGVFEGMAYSPDYKRLFVSVEEPLYPDGPRATVQTTDSWIRLIQFDAQTKMATAQYAYKLDPVAHPSTPENAFQVNGVSEILCVGNKQLLVVERSFSTGRQACTIKVFSVDLSNAEDVAGNTSLTMRKPIKPAFKKLLLNMDSLGIYTDNIEGLTFGPRLENGHQTLLFVADNNFSKNQVSQVFLFEIMP